MASSEALAEPTAPIIDAIAIRPAAGDVSDMVDPIPRGLASTMFDAVDRAEQQGANLSLRRSTALDGQDFAALYRANTRRMACDLRT